VWLLICAAGCSADDGAGGADGDDGADGADGGASTDAGASADGSTEPVVMPDPFETRRADLCDAMDCGTGLCDPFASECACPSGTFFDGRTCAEAVDCAAGECMRCPPPWTPALRSMAASEVLPVRSLVVGAAVEVHVALDSELPVDLSDDSVWTVADTLDLTPWTGELIRVSARHDSARCPEGAWATRTIGVGEDYGGPATQSPTDAVSMDADIWAGWASQVIDYTVGAEVDEEWSDPQLALGPATGDSFDIVALGEGGQITLGFEPAIRDGEGWDLAVFENSFSDTFLELAWVEVSSDGEHFARLDSASLTVDPVDAFGGIEPRRLGGLAGKFRRGWGTPFDLAQLRQHTYVQRGLLDLHRITHVRVVDIVGDGDAPDSFDRPIQDPFPTVESAGFDLEAVGALNLATEAP
jgi:hypothetical protein